MFDELSAPDLLLRLGAAVLAGAALGFERGQHGRVAGLRTTILVTLAATAAMIDATVWIGLSGREDSSFVQIDVMRFPLGILSGIGFIGAGAIVRRGDFVQGVSTAATLWLATVIGLCVGGGQLGLGLVVTGIGVIVLRPMKRFEMLWKREQHAMLRVESDGALSERDVRSAIRGADLQLTSLAAVYERTRCIYTCDVKWRVRSGDAPTPELVRTLAERDGVSIVEWRPSPSLPD